MFFTYRSRDFTGARNGRSKRPGRRVLQPEAAPDHARPTARATGRRSPQLPLGTPPLFCYHSLVMELNSKQRKMLEKAAQPLSPLVIVGQEGVTDGVSSMLSSQLEKHELVKLKFNEYKEEKQALSAGLAESTGATLVRIIGNVAIFYRESPEEDKRMFKRQLAKLSKESDDKE